MEGNEGGREEWRERQKKRFLFFWGGCFFRLLTEATAILPSDSFCHQLAAKSAKLHLTGSRPKFERLVNQDLALCGFFSFFSFSFSLSVLPSLRSAHLDTSVGGASPASPPHSPHLPPC